MFLLGVAGGIYLLAAILLQWTHGEKFAAPGRHTVDIDEPGTYVVWDNAETFFEGRYYSSSPGLPSGTTIRVIDEQTEEEIPTKSSLGASETLGNRETRYSVCTFRVLRPGKYSVVVADLPERRIFMVRRSILRHSLGLLSGLAFVSVAAVLLPLAIITVVEVKRHQCKKKFASQQFKTDRL